jgi:predicted secreted protein
MKRAGMRSRVSPAGLAVGALLAFAVAVATVMVAWAADPKPVTDRDSVQRQINHEIAWLARNGIYVTATGIASECAVVDVVNPTRPNRTFLRARYGSGICIERDAVRHVGCADIQIKPASDTKVVPDLMDLGLYEAERRAVTAGFGFALDCPGVGSKHPRRPRRLSPEASARISFQCPQPGSKAAANVPITLEATALLPGNYTYSVTAFSQWSRAPRCIDGKPK